MRKQRRMRVNTPNPTAQRLWVLVLCAVLGLVMSLAPARPAWAEGAQDATLTLHMEYASKGKTLAVGGVTATAYRVASLDDNVNHYELLDDFASLGMRFDEGLGAGEAKEAAERAARIVGERKLAGDAKSTSSSTGVAQFGALPYGVYLVMQTNAVGAAEGYEDFEPFLVSVPQITSEGVDFAVSVTPKLAPKPAGPAKPARPTTPVRPITPAKSPLAKTSDLLNQQLLRALALMGTVLVIAGLVLRRRRRLRS